MEPALKCRYPESEKNLAESDLFLLITPLPILLETGFGVILASL